MRALKTIFFSQLLIGGNCASFIRKDGWDIPDNDILPSPVHEPNYDSCCKQCQATSECTAFIFEPSSERCWPKRSIGSGGNAIGGTVTGYNRMCRSSLLESIVFWGREFQ
ncbi:unnamed protein product [Rotaria sp. Silwood1]|nr:unnamed protein product [Rotaria sp. Silwood1]